MDHPSTSHSKQGLPVLQLPTRTPTPGFCGARGRGWGAWLVLLALLLQAPGPSAYGESAKSLYSKGKDAEAAQKYEAAYEFYKQAYDKEPKDIRYRTGVERTRFYSAAAKVRRGQLLRNAGKPAEALVEFENATTIDPSLEIAQQEVNATRTMLEGKPAEGAAPPKSDIDKLLEQSPGPVELATISDQPITLKLTEDSKMIYETIGKLAGINVLFDPDYQSRKVRIELNGVSLQDALQIAALESKTFWRPVTKNTIFVAADNQQKRKELEQNVIKTFYLTNISAQTDLNDIANTLRNILELQKTQTLQSQNAIVVRGTPDQIALAEKLIADIDKPKPEVVVDIAVMQVSRNKARTLGLSPPTAAGVQLTPPASTSTTITNTNGTTQTASTPTTGSLTFNTFKHLNSSSYQVTLGPATANFLFSDSDSRIIQNPQIRALDGDKASLKIGDRIPVATGSFGIPTVGTGSTGFQGTVNTQFQYIDVGVNIDITPKVHADDDVTLKVMIEISSVTSNVTIGGISEPVIGQRKIEHEVRLKEGEVNIMGGIFEDQEVKSWSGIPGLGQIPLFRYLFASENKTLQENEIVFVMIPHIVRRQVLSPLNLKAIDIGNGTTIDLRRTLKPQAPPAPVETPATQAPQSLPQTTPAVTPQPQAMTGTGTNPAVAAGGGTGAPLAESSASTVMPPMGANTTPSGVGTANPSAATAPAQSTGGTASAAVTQPNAGQTVAAANPPALNPQALTPPAPGTGANGSGSVNTTPAVNGGGGMAAVMPASAAQTIQTGNAQRPPASQAAGTVTGVSAPVVNAARATARLRFDPPLISQAAGSTAALSVTLDSEAAVHSLSMQLQYDATALQLLNVVNGGYLSRDGQAATLVHRDTGDGKLQISLVRPPGAPGLAGQGTVFTLVLQLKKPGNSNIAPIGMLARDASGNPILTNAAGQASVQIQPPPPAAK